MARAVKVIVAAVSWRASAAVGCHDIQSDDVNSSTPAIATCAKNALWAKSTGINTNPEYYTNYVGLNANSSIVAFQCVLWHKGQNSRDANGTESWGCVHPCTSHPLGYQPELSLSLPLNFGPRVSVCQSSNVNCLLGPWTAWSACVDVDVEKQQTRTRMIVANQIGPYGSPCVGGLQETRPCLSLKSAGSTTPREGGWPWYVWILVVVGGLGLCLSVYFCYEAVTWKRRQKAAQKKKRGLKKATSDAVQGASAQGAGTSTAEVVSRPIVTPQPLPALAMSMPFPVETTSAPVAMYAASALPGRPMMHAFAPVPQAMYAAPAVNSA